MADWRYPPPPPPGWRPPPRKESRVWLWVIAFVAFFVLWILTIAIMSSDQRSSAGRLDGIVAAAAPIEEGQ